MENNEIKNTNSNSINISSSQEEDINKILYNSNNIKYKDNEFADVENPLLILYYKKYLSISKKVFFSRFINSLIPFNPNFYKLIKKKPDLTGPFIIYTFVIIFISVISNSLNEKNNLTYNFNLFTSKISFIIYGVGICFPIIISFLIRLISKKFDLIVFFSIYGYSFSNFFIVFILCTIFRNIVLKFSLIGIGLCFAISLSVINYYKIMNNIKGNKKIFVSFMIIIFHICLFLLFTLFFYKNNFKEKKNIMNSEKYKQQKKNFGYINNFDDNNTIKNDAINNGNNFTNLKNNISYTKNLIKINNDKKKNIIPIAISIDDKYSMSAYIFLFSLMENIGQNTEYNIYIMISNLKQKSKQRINSLINKYGSNKLNITYINMGNAFKNAKTVKTVTTATYYRISLPSLLPNIDKIIYSDVDVINNRDLTEMYNLEMPNNIYFLGPLDFVGDNYKDFINFDEYSEKYMNAGITLMNLKAMRQNNIEQKLKDFIAKHNSKLSYLDQTTVNIVCINNIGILPIKFAVFNFRYFQNMTKYNNRQNSNYRFREEELKEAFEHPYMIHFAGNKPWDRKVDYGKKEYWWYYVKKSDYFEEIRQKYNYNITDVDSIIGNFTPNLN